MKAVEGIIKGLSAFAVVAITYIDNTFSPLFWVLLVLVAWDILANVHKEGQQLTKIGSAFASIGGITVIEGHIGSPDVVRIVVAVLVLAYIQVVMPQVFALIKKIPFSANKTVNVTEQQALINLLQSKVDALETQAKGQLTNTAAAGSATTGAGYHV